MFVIVDLEAIGLFIHNVYVWFGYVWLWSVSAPHSARLAPMVSCLST